MGAATGKKLAEMGLRTLEDLAKRPELLSSVQRVGLQFHAEFQMRIPREEVEQVTELVRRERGFFGGEREARGKKRK